MNDPAPRRLAIGCAVPFAALAALAAFVVGAWLDRRTGGAAGITVVLALVVLAATAAVSRLSPNRSARLGSSLMFALMPLPLAIAASFDANRTIVSHGHVSGPFEALLFGAVVLAVPLSSTAVTALGAWIGGRLFGHARAFAVVRALAWLATIGAAGLLALAAIRMRRPTALGYVASLPVVEKLPPIDRPGAGEAEHAAIWIVRAPLSERAVAGERKDCIAWPRRTLGSVQPDRALEQLRMAHFDGCGALQMRRDEGRGYLILEDAAGKRLVFADAWIRSPSRSLPGSSPARCGRPTPSPRSPSWASPQRRRSRSCSCSLPARRSRRRSRTCADREGATLLAPSR